MGYLELMSLQIAAFIALKGSYFSKIWRAKKIPKF